LGCKECCHFPCKRRETGGWDPLVSVTCFTESKDLGKLQQNNKLSFANVVKESVYATDLDASIQNKGISELNAAADAHGANAGSSSRVRRTIRSNFHENSVLCTLPDSPGNKRKHNGQEPNDGLERPALGAGAHARVIFLGAAK
jgi:hypothetical protein